jgi:DNA-directed RNA polymerase specialized sigma24 family protein
MSTKKRERTEVHELAIQLYREQRSYLLLIAHQNAGNEAIAEEALQEAFISFLRGFDPGRGAPPLAWLTLALKRECWARRRAERLDRRAGQERERGDDQVGVVLDQIPSPADSLEDRVALCDSTRRRLASLKADERNGLGLLAAGFSYHEIAARRGWTYSKVNRCISEGRATLRRLAAA